MQLLKCSESFLAWSNVVAWEFLSGCQGIAIWLLKCSEHFKHVEVWVLDG